VVPRAILERPELYDDLQAVWSAFWFLNSSRPVGMSVGAIPLTEIFAYWDRLGVTLDEEDFGDKVRLIREMDMTYLADVREKQDKDT